MTDAKEPDLDSLLGAMVRSAASLELMLRVLLSSRIGPRGELVAAGEGVSRLIELSRVLAEAEEGMEADRLASLRDLLSGCKSAFSRRDQYVHGAWLVHPDLKGLGTMRSRRNRAAPQLEPVKADELRELRESFERLYLEVGKWIWNSPSGDRFLQP
ncbi:hypothetical protein AB0C77_29900 [Streptomyces sp. NPDC048629]|uniref:hypothetical protein n=1 Tax=Streptomyces sp. NPDC048629 TaxID=3154824 RepID=UPI003415497E